MAVAEPRGTHLPEGITERLDCPLETFTCLCFLAKPQQANGFNQGSEVVSVSPGFARYL